MSRPNTRPKCWQVGATPFSEGEWTSRGHGKTGAIDPQADLGRGEIPQCSGLVLSLGRSRQRATQFRKCQVCPKDKPTRLRGVNIRDTYPREQLQCSPCSSGSSSGSLVGGRCRFPRRRSRPIAQGAHDQTPWLELIDRTSAEDSWDRSLHSSLLGCRSPPTRRRRNRLASACSEVIPLHRRFMRHFAKVCVNWDMSKEGTSSSRQGLRTANWIGSPSSRASLPPEPRTTPHPIQNCASRSGGSVAYFAGNRETHGTSAPGTSRKS